MRKLSVPALIWGVSMSMWVGCSSSSTSPTDSISFSNAKAIDTVRAGSADTVKGSVVANNALHLAYMILALDSTGRLAPLAAGDTSVRVRADSVTPKDSINLTTDAHVVIRSDSTARARTYALVINANTPHISRSDTLRFLLIGPISITVNALDSIVAGATKSVAGTVLSNIPPANFTALTFAILDSAKHLLTDSLVKTTSTAISSGIDSIDLGTSSNLKIVVDSNARSGNYFLTLHAATLANLLNDTVPFRVINGRNVDTGQLVVGSVANTTIGNAVDLDGNRVLANAAAQLSGSGADIVMTFDTVGTDSFRIFSPAYAKDSSGLAQFSTWQSPSATSFVKTNINHVLALRNKNQLQQLYSVGTAVTHASAAVGDIFIAKTDKNNYVGILVVAFDPAVTGTSRILWVR